MADGRIDLTGARRLGRGEILVAGVGILWVGLAALWAAPGVLIIDGFVYHAMTDAFARSGSLFVENGYKQYGARSLQLHLLMLSDGRLAPQYPGGWGILSAPFYMAGDLRGLILLNAAASALTLPLVWVAAKALFDDRRIATTAALIYGLATFAADYAFAVWPHGLTVFLVTGAAAAALSGWRRGWDHEPGGALIAGACLGLAINIRVDALIAVVPIAIWLLSAARRPYACLGMLIVGMAPGLAFAAAINFVKFGTLSPITYGGGKGATSLVYYAKLAPLGIAGGVIALALGSERVRSLFYRPAVLIGGSAVVTLILIAIPQTRDMLIQIGQGFWILVVDFQSYARSVRGVNVIRDGAVQDVALVRKALLQSLPYAAIVLLLLPRGILGPNRAAIGFCFLFVGLIILPFAYSSWYGGGWNNMRYFLNSVPVLAILSAAAIHHADALAPRRRILSVGVMIAVAAAVIGYGILREQRFDRVLQYFLPNTVIIGIVLCTLLILAARGALNAGLVPALRGLIGLGLVSAFISGSLIDVQFSRQVRLRNAELAKLVQELPPNALVITYSATVAGLRVNRPPALTAEIDRDTLKLRDDLPGLVARAFAEGRPVFAQGDRLVAQQMVDQGLARDPRPRFGIDPTFDLFEMAPPQ